MWQFSNVIVSPHITIATVRLPAVRGIHGRQLAILGLGLFLVQLFYPIVCIEHIMFEKHIKMLRRDVRYKQVTKMTVYKYVSIVPTIDS